MRAEERMEQKVIEVKELSKDYVLKGETVKALDKVSMDIASREFMAIAGPSGSGKTTLLNIIGALDTPTQGEVMLEGEYMSRMSRREQAFLRRDRLGFIFQSYNLIPVLTVLENTEYVMLLQGRDKKERHQAARKVLSQVGMEGLEDRRPGELSGGQQQRVAVARAIVSKPSLVLADEPTANLDSVTGAKLLDTMSDLNSQLGITFVFSSHDRMVLERASRVVRLRDGRIDSDQRPN
jgi:putative ABC transport system ATP-binding protein